MIHPADTKSNNPRLQCSVCAKWMRLSGKDENGARVQRFFGGCGQNGGNDHLAGNQDGKEQDVCVSCCQKKCKELSHD